MDWNVLYFVLFNIYFFPTFIRHALYLLPTQDYDVSCHTTDHWVGCSGKKMSLSKEKTKCPTLHY